MSERITWDELFMSITRLYGERSVCKYFKVGVVFTRNNRILSAGYNGPPSGEPHCTEVGCAKEDKMGKKLPAGSGLCRGAHAEMNAIANASGERSDLRGSTVYCTYSPCYDCAKILVGLGGEGIKEYVYEKDYLDEDSKAIDLLKRHRIEVRKFQPERRISL